MPSEPETTAKEEEEEEKEIQEEEEEEECDNGYEEEEEEEEGEPDVHDGLPGEAFRVVATAPKKEVTVAAPGLIGSVPEPLPRLLGLSFVFFAGSELL